ncbi:hypothetical protein [Amycolatopsis sp. NPDC051128]|uniref:hypothetical protein n=1 Tax=Amycolatopsis sp. NPDC051128 TaxID=3155412 RepID=UPI0034487976
MGYPQSATAAPTSRNRFEEAVRSLDERPLTVPLENLERWTGGASDLGDAQ